MLREHEQHFTVSGRLAYSSGNKSICSVSATILRCLFRWAPPPFLVPFPSFSAHFGAPLSKLSIWSQQSGSWKRTKDDRRRSPSSSDIDKWPAKTLEEKKRTVAPSPPHTSATRISFLARLLFRWWIWDKEEQLAGFWEVWRDTPEVKLRVSTVLMAPWKSLPDESDRHNGLHPAPDGLLRQLLQRGKLWRDYERPVNGAQGTARSRFQLEKRPNRTAYRRRTHTRPLRLQTSDWRIHFRSHWCVR